MSEGSCEQHSSTIWERDCVLVALVANENDKQKKRSMKYDNEN